MISELSANTQATLLLTAPLVIGPRELSPDVLKPREFDDLDRFLRANRLEPAALLATEPGDLLVGCGNVFNVVDRVVRLRDRYAQLEQAVERWQQGAIWVTSRADSAYPSRLKQRLSGSAPPVLFGCGDVGILDSGGLAVVGSRHVSDELREYAAGIGRLTANAEWTLASGGARGIDLAAMNGALAEAGKAVGVLSHGLAKAAQQRDHHGFLLEDQLVLTSPYDPAAGFSVGNAMGRNKLIYALADAALVVNSDYGKGGTWAGAVEQLERLKLVPIYVRPDPAEGLQALIDRGARTWPEPQTPEDFWSVLAVGHDPAETSSSQLEFSL